MTMTRTSWSQERSCEHSSPCWRCRWVGWSPPSSSSTRCGVRSRRRRCETGCRASRRSCAERWARPISSPCAAAATPSSCRPTLSTCTGTSSWSSAGQAAAAEGDLGRAVDLLAEADALWRGDPLADFTYEDFAAAAITRLSELRLAVIEERLDLELQLGRHQGAIVQLEELVDRASAAGAPARPADDRPVPRRTAGRRAPGLPGGSPHPRRGARSRAGTRAAPAGVGDPGPGPIARCSGRSTRPHRASRPRSTIPESLTPLGRTRRGAARPHAAGGRASPRHARRARWSGQDTPRARGGQARVRGPAVRRVPGRAGSRRRSSRRPGRDRVGARPPRPEPAGRGDRRSRGAAGARQLRARDRDGRRGGRGAAAPLPRPAPHRHQPRGAASRR